MEKVKNKSKVFILATIALCLIILVGCTTKSPHEENTKSNEIYIEKIEETTEVIKSPSVPEKITVGGKQIQLENDVVLETGDKVENIQLIAPTGTFDTMEAVDLLNTKGWKVLHIVPSLDTPVCSMQTKQLNAAAQEFSDIQFTTISADLPFAQRRFIIENNFEYMKVLSDFQGNKFAKENGLFMPEFMLMTRAIIILDENDTIQYIQYAEAVETELDLHNAINFVRQNAVS